MRKYLNVVTSIASELEFMSNNMRFQPLDSGLRMERDLKLVPGMQMSSPNSPKVRYQVHYSRVPTGGCAAHRYRGVQDCGEKRWDELGAKQRHAAWPHVCEHITYKMTVDATRSDALVRTSHAVISTS